MTATPATTTDLGLLEREAVMTGDSARELIVTTGADRSRFLHGIVTGNVAGTAVGDGCRSVLLTPKGHIVADMQLFALQDAIWIVVDTGQARGVAEALGRYAIMDDFVATPQADFAILSLLGPKAPERLRSLGIASDLVILGELAHADVELPEGRLWIARVRELGADGFWLGGPRALLDAVRKRLADAATPELDPTVAEAARIAALEPRFGSEITADYFPMEVGLDGAIDYTKGCYLGQEPIVRIRDRGHVNWRVVRLDLAGPQNAAPNDPLETDAKPKAGRITSAGRLPNGPGVALAMLHMSVPVGATVRVRHGDDRLEAQVRAERAPQAGK